jgi:hypothetical protein
MFIYQRVIFNTPTTRPPEWIDQIEYLAPNGFRLVFHFRWNHENEPKKTCGWTMTWKNMRNHEDFIMAAWGCHEDLSNLLSWDTSCVVINNPNQAMVILKDYTHPIGFWILSAGSPRLPQVYGSCYPPLYSSHCLRLDAPMQVQGGKKKVNIQVTYGQNDQSSIIMLNHA